MKYQALFYQKNNEIYSRLWSAAVVIDALMVNTVNLSGLDQLFKYQKTDDKIVVC